MGSQLGGPFTRAHSRERSISVSVSVSVWPRPNRTPPGPPVSQLMGSRWGVTICIHGIQGGKRCMMWNASRGIAALACVKFVVKILQPQDVSMCSFMGFADSWVAAPPSFWPMTSRRRVSMFCGRAYSNTEKYQSLPVFQARGGTKPRFCNNNKTSVITKYVNYQGFLWFVFYINNKKPSHLEKKTGHLVYPRL